MKAYIHILVTYFSHAMSIPFYLTIVHQNDIHSHYDMLTSNAVRCSDETQRKIRQGETTEMCYGGYPRAVWWKRYICNRTMNCVNFHAGDIYQGTEFYSVFKWHMAANMTKYMEYDALAVGNTEFRDGLAGFEPFLKLSQKFLCTNINFSKHELNEICPRYRIMHFTREGVSNKKAVGILGYTSNKAVFGLENSKEVSIGDEIESLTRYAKELVKQGVKIIVAVGHSGYDRDLQIAKQVPHLDVIIGGHSHTLNWPNDIDPFKAGVPADKADAAIARGVYPTTVVQPSGRKVLVAQMYKHGKYIGVLNVTFNDDDEVIQSWGLPKLLTMKTPEDSGTKKMMSYYTHRLREMHNRRVGRTLVVLTGSKRAGCRQVECNMGSMFADAVVWWLLRVKKLHKARCTTAIINSGGLKHDVPIGNITLKNMLDMFPYQNTIDVVELRGSTLEKALIHSVSESNKKHGRFLQVSGLQVEYDLLRPRPKRMIRAQVLCVNCSIPTFEDIRPNAIYRVAVTTYVSNGGDGYGFIRDERVGITKQHELDLDVMMLYLKHMSPVHPGVEERLIIRGQHRRRSHTKSAAAATASALLLIALLAFLLIPSLGKGFARTCLK